jgi:hypothetical protein
MSVSLVRLEGRVSASSEPRWLAGLSAGCGRFSRNGRTFLAAPMSACWVDGGEMGLFVEWGHVGRGVLLEAGCCHRSNVTCAVVYVSCIWFAVGRHLGSIGVV